jgi:hypothetical protein
MAPAGLPDMALKKEEGLVQARVVNPVQYLSLLYLASSLLPRRLVYWIVDRRIL